MSRADESAFPCERSFYQQGVTLREYLAGQALSRCIEIAAEFVISERDFQPGTRGLSEVIKRGCQMAVHTADTLLVELAKPPRNGDADQAALRG